MTSQQKDLQSLKISSPEKVARLLEKAGETGLPLLIRALSNPRIAVKGRAKKSPGPVNLHGFKVCNISDRGYEYLAENANGGIQVEFVLSHAKVVFYSSISHFSQQDCTLSVPDSLISIERRKNARFQVAGSNRAFLTLSGWEPKSSDLGSPPFFGSCSNLTPLIPVGDVSLGGLSVVDRFPAVCSKLAVELENYEAKIHLPMINPISLKLSLRWHRKTKDVISDLEGKSRIIGAYRFGLQFLDPSEELLENIKSFIQLISQAEAI